jgi:hypothetical protein
MARLPLPGWLARQLLGSIPTGPCQVKLITSSPVTPLEQELPSPWPGDGLDSVRYAAHAATEWNWLGRPEVTDG